MFLLDPLEEKERKLQEDRKRLEAREIEIYKREEALKERQLLKTDPLTQKENKSESITQPANKTELRKDIDKRMSIKGENNESTELKGISSENIYPEKQPTFPKFSVFSGKIQNLNQKPHLRSGSMKLIVLDKKAATQNKALLKQ